MFTTGAKWFFGIAGAALLGAWIYGAATNPDEIGMSSFTGVLSLGYKGGVGDHLGFTILMGIVGVALVLGATTAAFRDSSAEAGAELLEVESVPAVEASEKGSYWPIISVFGVGALVIGLVTSPLFFVLGLVTIAAAAFEWAITAWAEKATGDPEVNQSIRRRVMLPIEIPVLGGLGIALLVVSISRILLAAPKLAVYLIFGAVPFLVLVIAFVLAARPKVNRSLVAVLCVVGALGILAAGIFSVAVGPREIEEHKGEGEQEGLAPVAPGEPVVLRGSIR